MNSTFPSPIYIIEKSKILHNIQQIITYANGRRVYAVLKANGYGLGNLEFAKLCLEGGLRCFAANDIHCIEELSASGLVFDDLLFLASPNPADIPRLLDLHVTFTVANDADAKNLMPYHVNAHLKLDSGMGRRGFMTSTPYDIAELYQKYDSINFTGIYTHFANSANRKYTKKQFDRFMQVINTLKSENISPGICHCCSSSSAFYYDEMLLDGIRVGSAILGRLPRSCNLTFHRTGICSVAVETVKPLPKGSTVGYGCTYKTRHDLTIALCPLGTHNGFGSTCKSGAQIFPAFAKDIVRRIINYFSKKDCLYGIINGHKCRVLGNICSEMTVLDVSDIICHAGDVAQFDINPIVLNDVPVLFI